MLGHAFDIGCLKEPTKGNSFQISLSSFIFGNIPPLPILSKNAPVINRLRDVSRLKKSYTYHEEYKRMFDYIVDNNFRIDIKDSRFMIEESGNIFSQYPHWDVIRKKSIEFRT